MSAVVRLVHAADDGVLYAGPLVRATTSGGSFEQRIGVDGCPPAGSSRDLVVAEDACDRDRDHEVGRIRADKVVVDLDVLATLELADQQASGRSAVAAARVQGRHLDPALRDRSATG